MDGGSLRVQALGDTGLSWRADIDAAAGGGRACTKMAPPFKPGGETWRGREQAERAARRRGRGRR